MITVGVRFLDKTFFAELTRPPAELAGHLQSIGVLTSPDNITLDNARTLKVELYPGDEMGMLLMKLVNKYRDTLGGVNRLCHGVNRLDDKRYWSFRDMLTKGKIKTVEQGLAELNKPKRIFKVR